MARNGSRMSCRIDIAAANDGMRDAELRPHPGLRRMCDDISGQVYVHYRRLAVADGDVICSCPFLKSEVALLTLLPLMGVVHILLPGTGVVQGIVDEDQETE